MVGILSSLVFLPIASSAIVFAGGYVSERASRALAVVFAGINLALSLWLLLLFDRSSPSFQFTERIDWASSFGLTYSLASDGISLPLILITTFLTFLAATGSLELITFRIKEYYALLLLLQGAIMGVFLSMDLVLFYVFWELVLIPMFFFIGIWGGPRRKYAAMKFLIFTHVGSTIMLLGFLALFAWSPAHTFDFDQLAKMQLPRDLQLFAAVATFFGFAFKLPAVPFHTWLPDAHVEAPAPISVLLAGLLLKMGGYGFIRFNLQLLPEASSLLSPVYIGFGLLTIFYGAFVAMLQQDLKRMIALTSINHMGYVLLGSFTFNLFGLAGAVFQMFSHACAIGALFLLSGVIHEHAGTRMIGQLHNLGQMMPKTSFVLIMASLAAMGIPGFSNFISEYMVLVGAISTNWLYIAAIGAPLLTVCYFLWMMSRVVIVKHGMPPVKRSEASWYTVATLASFIVPILLLGVYPTPMLTVINPSAEKILSLYR